MYLILKAYFALVYIFKSCDASRVRMYCTFINCVKFADRTDTYGRYPTKALLLFSLANVSLVTAQWRDLRRTLLFLKKKLLLKANLMVLVNSITTNEWFVTFISGCREDPESYGYRSAA